MSSSSTAAPDADAADARLLIGTPPAAPKSAPAAPPPRKFRVEIQGLRAVDAFFIAAGHVMTPSATGGVGMFFVLAGILVLSSMHRDASASATAAPLAFVARALDRIVPEVVFTIIAVVALTASTMPALLAETLADGSAAAAFALNWRFFANATDYYARDAESSPLLLFWSLAVIVQVYVAHALVYTLLARLGPRVGLTTPARVDAAGVTFQAAVVAASLGYTADLALRGKLQMAYFHTGVWAWMFSLGALVGRALPAIRVSEHVSLGLGAAALALGSTMVAFIMGNRFVPPLLRQSPVAMVLLVTLAGTAEGSNFALRIFRHPRLVHLGSLSYWVFLLHWPLTMLYKQRVADDPSAGALIPFWDGVGILAASFALAEALSRLFALLRARLLDHEARKAAAKSGLVVFALLLPLILSLAAQAQTAGNAVAGGGAGYGSPLYSDSMLIPDLAQNSSAEAAGYDYSGIPNAGGLMGDGGGGATEAAGAAGAGDSAGATAAVEGMLIPDLAQNSSAEAAGHDYSGIPNAGGLTGDGGGGVTEAAGAAGGAGTPTDANEPAQSLPSASTGPHLSQSSASRPSKSSAPLPSKSSASRSSKSSAPLPSKSSRPLTTSNDATIGAGSLTDANNPVQPPESAMLPSKSAAPLPSTSSRPAAIPAPPPHSRYPFPVDVAHPGAHIFEDGFSTKWTKSSTAIAPPANRAKSDYDSSGYNRHVCPECLVQIALIGASHALQWQAVLSKIASKHGWGFFTRYRELGGCDIYDKTLPDECEPFMRESYAKVLALKPNALFVLGTYGSTETNFDESAQLYNETRGRVIAAGIRVVALRDFPRPGGTLWPTECAVKNGAYASKCDHTTQFVREPAWEAVKQQGVGLIDLRWIVCPDSHSTNNERQWVCPAVIGNVYVWRDYHHVTGTYLASAANIVEDAIRAVRPPLPLKWKG